MKAVICGAGQVGYTIAAYLSRENNDITIVDSDAENVARVSSSLDVNGVVGHASHPDALEKAGIRDADMIIAVTASDEVNMVACQVAHSLFNVPKKSLVFVTVLTVTQLGRTCSHVTICRLMLLSRLNMRSPAPLPIALLCPEQQMMYRWPMVSFI